MENKDFEDAGDEMFNQDTKPAFEQHDAVAEKQKTEQQAGALAPDPSLNAPPPGTPLGTPIEEGTIKIAEPAAVVPTATVTSVEDVEAESQAAGISPPVQAGTPAYRQDTVQVEAAQAAPAPVVDNHVGDEPPAQHLTEHPVTGKSLTEDDDEYWLQPHELGLPVKNKAEMAAGRRQLKFANARAEHVKSVRAAEDAKPSGNTIVRKGDDVA